MIFTLDWQMEKNDKFPLFRNHCHSLSAIGAEDITSNSIKAVSIKPLARRSIERGSPSHGWGKKRKETSYETYFWSLSNMKATQNYSIQFKVVWLGSAFVVALPVAFVRVSFRIKMSNGHAINVHKGAGCGAPFILNDTKVSFKAITLVGCSQLLVFFSLNSLIA